MCALSLRICIYTASVKPCLHAEVVGMYAKEILKSLAGGMVVYVVMAACSGGAAPTGSHGSGGSSRMGTEGSGGSARMGPGGSGGVRGEESLDGSFAIQDVSIGAGGGGRENVGGTAGSEEPLDGSFAMQDVSNGAEG